LMRWAIRITREKPLTVYECCGSGWLYTAALLVS
jgi:hypothetical protein